MSKAGTKRHNAQRDKNERAIIAALEAIGCLVQPLSDKGVPDLMVWSPRRACIVLLEVKDGSKPPSARKLKPEQVAWHLEWITAGAPVYVVTSVTEAMVACGWTTP